MTSEPTETRCGSYTVTTIRTAHPWRENTYVVTDTRSGEQTVVDPGDAADVITLTLSRYEGTLRHVLLTHGHHDHVAGVAALRRRFDVPCYLHEADARLLRHAPMYALRFGGQRLEPVEGVTLLNSDPDLRLGDTKIEAIHTPGHTGGSVCYVLPGCAFTGDTLLHESVGRTDLPGGDMGLLLSSVNALLDCLPDDSLLFPGHGRPWTAGQARAWWKTASAAPRQHKS